MARKKIIGFPKGGPFPKYNPVASDATRNVMNRGYPTSSYDPGRRMQMNELQQTLEQPSEFSQRPVPPPVYSKINPNAHHSSQFGTYINNIATANDARSNPAYQAQADSVINANEAWRREDINPYSKTYKSRVTGYPMGGRFKKGGEYEDEPKSHMRAVKEAEERAENVRFYQEYYKKNPTPKNLDQLKLAEKAKVTADSLAHSLDVAVGDRIQGRTLPGEAPPPKLGSTAEPAPKVTAWNAPEPKKKFSVATAGRGVLDDDNKGYSIDLGAGLPPIKIPKKTTTSPTTPPVVPKRRIDVTTAGTGVPDTGVLYPGNPLLGLPPIMAPKKAGTVPKAPPVVTPVVPPKATTPKKGEGTKKVLTPEEAAAAKVAAAKAADDAASRAFVAGRAKEPKPITNPAPTTAKVIGNYKQLPRKVFPKQQAPLKVRKNNLGDYKGDIAAGIGAIANQIQIGKLETEFSPETMELPRNPYTDRRQALINQAGEQYATTAKGINDSSQQGNNALRANMYAKSLAGLNQQLDQEQQREDTLGLHHQQNLTRARAFNTQTRNYGKQLSMENRNEKRALTQANIDNVIRSYQGNETVRQYMKTEGGRNVLIGMMSGNRGTSERDLARMSEEQRNLLNLQAYGGTFKHGGIYIKPKNRGKFNALKKRTGKTTAQLKHSKNPLTRKRATFAANAKKWKH